MVIKNGNKNVDVTFHPFKGLGQIMFTSKEDDVIKLLGNPEEMEDIVDEDSKVVLYYYNTKPSIDCLFHYEKNQFDHLSIFTQNVILDGFDVASASKDMVFDYIKEYHKKNEIDFISEVSHAVDVDEDYYQFDNIGLTIWYAGEFVSEICIQQPQK
jgi:hypothetical protein